MSGLCQLGAPPTVSSPRDGARNPAIMCSMVDLPAPFGPSRPVTPGPIVIVMSLTATTLPYQRETLRSSIVLTTHPPSGTWRRGRPGSTASSTRNMTPYRMPTLPGGGMGPGFVPPSHCLTPSSTLNGLISPPSLAPSGATACGPSGTPARPDRSLLSDVDQDRGQRPGEEQVDRDHAGGVGAAAGQRGEHQPDRREQHRPEHRDAHAGNQRPGLGPDRGPAAGGEDVAHVEDDQRDLQHQQARGGERGVLCQRVVQAAHRPRHVQRQHVAAQVPGHQLRRLGRHEDQHDQGPQPVGVGVVVDYRGLTGVLRHARSR